MKGNEGKYAGNLVPPSHTQGTHFLSPTTMRMNGSDIDIDGIEYSRGRFG